MSTQTVDPRQRIKAGRQAIDAFTSAIIRIAADRTETAHRLNVAKRDLGLPVTDETREAQVIKNAGETAVKVGLIREDGEELAALLIKISKRGQE